MEDTVQYLALITLLSKLTWISRRKYWLKIQFLSQQSNVHIAVISKRKIMPSYACQYFYDCKSCGALIKPKQGDCCVFYSYGSVKCPPIQQNNCCGGGGC